MNGKFYFSETDEHFSNENGPYETRLAAMLAAIEHCDPDFEDQPSRLFTHTNKQVIVQSASPPVFFTCMRRDVDLVADHDFGTSIVEEIEQGAADECGSSSDHCMKYTANCIDELDRKIKAVVSAWVAEHLNFQPWVAENQFEHRAGCDGLSAGFWSYEIPLSYQELRHIRPGDEVAPGCIALETAREIAIGMQFMPMIIEPGDSCLHDNP